jgi:hypothetical protein
MPDQENATLREYQDWTAQLHQRTHGRGLEHRSSLIYASFGLCCEIGELREEGADELLEAGDVLSCACLAAHLLELDVSKWIPEDCLDHPELCSTHYDPSSAFTVHPRADLLDEVLTHALKFGELIKKHVFQDKPYDHDLGLRYLRLIVRRLAAYVGAHGYSMRQIILANTLKLESRYPPSTGPE